MVYQLASQADDQAIRQLLKDNPMGGDIMLTLEREPSYFKYCGVEGPFHQTIIAKEKESLRLTGMASRAIRPYYVNGCKCDIGYLGQLRFIQEFRRFFPLAQGFAFLKKLHADGRTPFYLTSIMEDNQTAKRILTSGHSTMPLYREYCRYVTHILPTRRIKPYKTKDKDIHVESGSKERVEELIHFLDQNNKNLQFAPVWDNSNLFCRETTPGLTVEDFVLAIKDEKIIGCIALWDQRKFKQTVIRGYSAAIGRWRHLLNIMAFLKGYPTLPAIDSTISYGFLSHVCIQENKRDLFLLLLETISLRARKKKIPLLTAGFATKHPFHVLLKDSCTTFQNRSKIYLVFWDDSEYFQPDLIDDRLPGIEAALL